MPAFDYARMRSTADRLMGRFKQGTCVLVREEPGASPVGQPWQPGAPAVTRTDLAAAARGVDQKFVDGTTILSSDLMIVCAVPAVRPDMATDWVEIDGRRHTIVRSEPIPPAGTAVAWRLILRA